MQGGRIVQQGTYDELLAREGLFQQLAKRQLV
jgi:ABC-type multidrug transport system fused ATPase/permease subunit